MVTKTFSTFSRSWYGRETRPDEGAVDVIHCSVKDEEAGMSCGFSFDWHELQGLSVKLTMWDDAFAAFPHILNLLDILQDDSFMSFSVEEMEAALKSCGFEDTTKTVRDGDIEYFRRREIELSRELTKVKSQLEELESRNV